MTKPSMRCVRTFGLTTAWGGGALSPWLQTPRETASTGEGEEEAGGGAPEPGGELRSGGEKRGAVIVLRRTIPRDVFTNSGD